MTGRQFSHAALAARLRQAPGEWMRIDRAYATPDVARGIRYQIEGGRLPAYQPKGAFRARTSPVRGGYGWQVEVRYVGDHQAAPEPLVIHWTGLITHPGENGGDTIVHCQAADGQTVHLLLDDEHREALGGPLVDPHPDEEEEVAA